MIKVIIADDQPVIRDGLKFIVEQSNEIQVLGCAGHGLEALELCEKLNPDLVLMDIVMPICDGVEGTRLIKEKFENIKVMILTTFNDEDKVEQALKNGADGYILKAIESEELILTIKSVARGLQVIHKNAYNLVLKKLSSEIEAKDFGLTERESEVIKLIVFGKSNKEIASKLYLTEGSVRNLISSILFKTKLKDRTQLAVFAVKNNII
ncbi:MAG: response regulator transcription factor [Clostridia bacterium]|nr:response regulator transcription factor [Clostridia bacterium]